MKTRTLQIIHMAFMMSVFMYLGFGYCKGTLLPLQLRPITPEVLNTLRIGLYVTFALSLLVLYMVMEKMREQGKGDEMTPHLVKRACYESGALYGLALNLMGGDFNDQLGLSIPALTLMALSFPRRNT